VALRVEVSYVGDMLADARLVQAYGFCVPSVVVSQPSKLRR